MRPRAGGGRAMCALWRRGAYRLAALAAAFLPVMVSAQTPGASRDALPAADAAASPDGLTASDAEASPDALPAIALPLIVVDTPSDDGSSLTVRWDPNGARAAIPSAIARSGETSVTVERSQAGSDSFTVAGTAPFSDGAFVDSRLGPGNYRYRLAFPRPANERTSEAGVAANGVAANGAGVNGGSVRAQSPSRDDAAFARTTASAPAAPRANAFRAYRLNAFLLVLAMFALVTGFVSAARRGVGTYLRRIAGIDAIEEAVGRAAEMGRKILYIPGVISVGDPQTLASLGILGHVARLTARHRVRLEVPNIDPLTMTAARAIVKQAYAVEDASEEYDDGMVHYITSDLFAYTAAVNGTMVRDRPAANFFVGWFAAESLLLAETGQSVGAIQIAGTAQVAQLPFFVAACDYTMLGEELFAASAELSKEPKIVGSVKAQDVMKAALVAAILAGVVLATAGVTGFVDWFTVQ